MASKKSDTIREGVLVRVRVLPHARKENVEERGGVLTISVREPAKGNQANMRIREIVATRFAVPLAHVRMVTGARSPQKLIRIIT